VTYKPNFNDPRIRNRAQKALNFVNEWLPGNRIRPIGIKLLYRHFSNTTRPLGHWLQQQLLENTDPHWNYTTGKCKSYRACAAGLELVQNLLGTSNQYQATPAVQAQIDSGNFEYVEKSQRWYSPVQYIPSRQRGRLLANNGYIYSYDIKAAAPTLLLQQAQSLNSDFTAPALTEYILNRSRIRDQIAAESCATAEQVKLVINAVLQGSVLSSWNQSQLSAALGHDRLLIARLRSSDTLKLIQQDISAMWRSLRDQFPVRTQTDKSGRTRRCRLTASEKSEYYRRLEQQVARSIKRYLKSKRVRFLWVHDGWQCDKAIDPGELLQRVRTQTGFVLELDWTIYQD